MRPQCTFKELQGVAKARQSGGGLGWRPSSSSAWSRSVDRYRIFARPDSTLVPDLADAPINVSYFRRLLTRMSNASTASASALGLAQDLEASEKVTTSSIAHCQDLEYRVVCTNTTLGLNNVTQHCTNVSTAVLKPNYFFRNSSDVSNSTSNSTEVEGMTSVAANATNATNSSGTSSRVRPPRHGAGHGAGPGQLG